VAKPSLWGFRKLISKPYPVSGAAITHPVNQLVVDLKDYLQTAVISRLFIRVKGTIAQVGNASVGTATGRDNPEALFVNVTARATPALGAVSKNSLTARGTIQQGIFDRGYAIHGTAITDPSSGTPTATVDFSIPLQFKMPGSVNPIEWGLPLGLFTSYQLTMNFGGRDQLFTGGAVTWDPSGLNVEIWADYDDGVAGNFHLFEEFEQTVAVTQTQPDLQAILEPGFFYTHLLFIAQTANAKDNTLINGITVQSAGRVWTPQGDKNAAEIQRWNQETHVNNAAESLTGTYFIPALRDGMFTRAIDATQSRVEVKFDVTFGAGPSNIIIRGRRIRAQALQVQPAKAA
jgi:hypothetical protein